MKFLICITISILFSSSAFSQDAEDKEVLKRIAEDNYTHIVKTPKGNLKGHMVFKKNGVAQIVLKKDYLLGLDVKKVKVAKKGGRHWIKADLITDAKFLGVIMLRDPNNYLGEIENPIASIQAKTEVYVYNGKRPNGLPLFESNGKKESLFVLGKVKLGAFSGWVSAEGKKGKAKYKIFPDLPLGMLVGRVNSGKPELVSIQLKKLHQHAQSKMVSSAVALMLIEGKKGKIDVILNDSQTKNNKGSFYIVRMKK